MKARRIFTLTVMALAMLFPLFTSSPASASTGEFVSKINALRSSKGLAPLSVDSNLNSVAAAWNANMAAAGKISHNPSFSSQISGTWTKVGENVGVGGSVDSIFDALVASPGHYRNMVDPSFNRIGVAVTTGADGRLYTTHNFAAFPGSSSAAPSAPKAAAAKATTSTKAPAAKAAPKATTSTKAPAPAASAAKSIKSAPAAEAAAPAPAPAPVPVPSNSIVQGLAEIGSLSTQG